MARKAQHDGWMMNLETSPAMHNSGSKTNSLKMATWKQVSGDPRRNLLGF